MKKTFLATLQYALFAALAVFFVWLSVRGLDHEKWEQLKKAMDGTLLVTLTCFQSTAHVSLASRSSLEATHGTHGISSFPSQCFFCSNDWLLCESRCTPFGRSCKMHHTGTL